MSGRAQVRDKFNQQMDWDKHLSKKDLRRAEREQLAFLKVQYSSALAVHHVAVAHHKREGRERGERRGQRGGGGG